MRLLIDPRQPTRMCWASLRACNQRNSSPKIFSPLSGMLACITVSTRLVLSRKATRKPEPASSPARSNRNSITRLVSRFGTWTSFPARPTTITPLAHQLFPNWEVGSAAHAQHVRAYAGWPVSGRDMIVDPRYGLVIGKHTLTHWAELGGKWAPSPTYGTEIENLMQKLIN
jgi:hypothetical protein